MMWHFKLLPTRLFVQWNMRNNKSKFPITGTLWMECNGEWWIPLTGSVSHTTSSWCVFCVNEISLQWRKHWKIVGMIGYLEVLKATSALHVVTSHDGVSSHRQLYCVFNLLLKAYAKENIKALRCWPLVKRNYWRPLEPPVTTQRTSNVENNSMRWRRHQQSPPGCQNNSFFT